MKYNYFEELKHDIRTWIADNKDYILKQEFEDFQALEEWLNDTLWLEDSVTGNASGSYTFNTSKAKEYVLDNIMDALDTYTEYCSPGSLEEDMRNNDWEKIDVSIRCYLLCGAIYSILDSKTIESLTV